MDFHFEASVIPPLYSLSWAIYPCLWNWSCHAAMLLFVKFLKIPHTVKGNVEETMGLLLGRKEVDSSRTEWKSLIQEEMAVMHKKKKKQKLKRRDPLKSVCLLLQISLGVGVLIIMLFFSLPTWLKGITIYLNYLVQHRYFIKNKKDNLLFTFSKVSDDQNHLKYLSMQITRTFALKS